MAGKRKRGKGGINLLQKETGATDDFRENHKRLREEALGRIGRLQNKFTAELLAASLFLLLSIGALSDFALLPSFSDNVRAALGHPPSVNMISAVLILYIFSALTLILSRMMSGSGKCGGISHVGYIAGFYFFYHFSGKLPENFWAVFAAGVTILVLEIYHLWIYTMEEIAKEQETLANLGRHTAGPEDKDHNPS